MVAAQYAGGCRAEPAGPPIDLLAFHRRATASLRRSAAEPGAEERAVRAIRALAKGASAVGPRRCQFRCWFCRWISAPDRRRAARPRRYGAGSQLRRLLLSLRPPPRLAARLTPSLPRSAAAPSNSPSSSSPAITIATATSL